MFASIVSRQIMRTSVVPARFIQTRPAVLQPVRESMSKKMTVVPSLQTQLRHKRMKEFERRQRLGIELGSAHNQNSNVTCAHKTIS
eukprot:Awhi_evm2s9260